MEDLTSKNFKMFAAQNYYSLDAEEFDEDIKRFKYLKRLINKYQSSGDLSERLILNHMTVIFNVFGIGPSLKMLEHKIGINHWNIIKPFLIFMKAIKVTDYTGIAMDTHVVDKLRQI